MKLKLQIKLTIVLALFSFCVPSAQSVDQDARRHWNNNIKELDKIHGRKVQPGVYRGPYGPRNVYPARGGALILDRKTEEEIESKPDIKSQARESFKMQAEKKRVSLRTGIESRLHKTIDKAYSRSKDDLEALWKLYLEKHEELRARAVEKHVLPPEVVDNFMDEWKPDMNLKFDENNYLTGRLPKLVDKDQFSGELSSNAINSRIEEYSKSCQLNAKKKQILLRVFIGDFHDLISSYLNYRATFMMANNKSISKLDRYAHELNLEDYKFVLSQLCGESAIEKIDANLTNIAKKNKEALEKYLDRKNAHSEPVGSPSDW